jgi:hypothetical protein
MQNPGRDTALARGVVAATPSRADGAGGRHNGQGYTARVGSGCLADNG